jgi:ubiquinone/menaquinone biosynthesis C-methylase UbiE
MRVFDLGCGSGRDLAVWGVRSSDDVVGLDLDSNRVTAAQIRFPHRVYLQGTGERLPFPDESFDRVISSVGLPYMNIPKTLSEIYRVLSPGGSVSLSLHLPSFTMAELLHTSLPKPIPTLFRLYVIANGVWFHCTGTTVRSLNRRTESFQTERGMRTALVRAGFSGLSFRRTKTPSGEEFIAEAKKGSTRNALMAKAG